ncbi:phosphatase [Pseudoclavibacter sp. RFBJ3]|uniref:HAD-IA family hydrolase n=1 Tax=unclassified Pseudoclavibacter TaxID=2615177 RepID=UPI000CE82613|nr:MULTISPECIES: HAD-IA family hydrolase [unclassified Pseudoclavibacter]PPF80473.1 phosphatase [Pseudoclavibacter sp. RFBJ5]PPF90186.1 phosphatase [Pseudoclavibacter sp. RFBJ3]PPG00520.1 phosphatase [Pseudoclavibacter sp. RFBH5]PPG19262.1 phosphatase [Pseudoclavibacter sp. RFBI4]
MTSTVHPVAGFLFDCDGVLVDSLEAAAVAWDAWAETHAPGYDFRTQVEHGVRAADTVAQLVSPDSFAGALAALEAAEIAGADATLAIPGSIDLTTSIPDASFAVVTSGTRALAEARLLAAGHRVPAALVTAESVTKGKPDAEPYRRGAELLGLDPADCVALEDAPAGVEAARAAGVGFIIGVGDHLEDAVVDAHVLDLRALSYEDGRLTIVDAL